MNKKIFAAVVCLCAFMEAPVFAGQSDSGNDSRKENRAKSKAPEAPNPFEGLELTADQQTKLDALKKERAEARKSKAEARQAQAKEQRIAKREAAKKARVEELAKIKEILTPEQYVKFLENSYLKTNKVNKAGKFNGRLARHDRKGDRGRRPERDRTPYDRLPAPQPLVEK